jgi:hypothetical protein
MLPTDIAAFSSGKSVTEMKAAHIDHHERLHATSVVVAKPSATASANVTALRAAITAATVSQHGYNYGAEVFVAPGIYPLDETIEIRGVSGLRLRGAGAATVFVWAGAADQPMFRVAMSRECTFEHFRIFMQSQGYAGIQVLRDAASGVFAPSHNCFRNLIVQCENTTEFAIMLGGTGSLDANNDFHLFEHCTFSGYTNMGVCMSGSQAYNQQFINCSLWGGTGADYGYYTNVVGATVRVIGGGLYGHSVADFFIGRSDQAYVIQFVNSEGSARFIMCPDESYRQLSVENCRWAGNALHADGKAIVTTGLINMALKYCSIGGGQDPTGNLYLDFASTGTASGGGVIMEGCRIVSAAADIFPSDAPVSVTTSTKITHEGNLTQSALTTAG